MSLTNVDLLRHTLATVAYRAAKTLKHAPADFSDYSANPGTRTPIQILAHVGDLWDWAAGLVAGQHTWHESTPLPWDAEIARFFAGLQTFDEALAAADPATVPCEKLFQGPISDALTHVGQIAMLRRMAASPIRGENYFVAKVVAGQVGPEQAPPLIEF